MSEEYDSNNVYYSPFWPMTIVLAGFILWFGIQIVYLVEQKNTASTQLAQMVPTLQRAQVAQNRLVSLLKDLAETSSKDPYAAQIMKEAEDAGLIRVTPNANAASSAAPTSSNDSTPQSSNQ